MKKMILMLMVVLSINLFAESKESYEEMFYSEVKNVKANSNFPQKIDDYIYWIDLFVNKNGVLVYEYQIVKSLNQKQINEFKKHMNVNMSNALCNDKLTYEVIMVKHNRDVNVNYRYEGQNLISIKVNKEICKKYRK